MSRPPIRTLFLDSIPHWGGGEKWCVQTARSLGQRGLSVTIGCAPGSELESRAVGAGLSVWRIPHTGLATPLAGLALSKFLSLECIDLVVANVGRDLRLAAMACSLSGKKLVQRRGIARPLKRDWLHRKIYRNWVSMVVANCQVIVDRMREGGAFLPADRFRVIPNGIELPTLSDSARAKARSQLGLAHDQIAVGMLGRLSPMKGLDNLIIAWNSVAQKFPKAQLLLAGTGDLRADLEQLVRDRGLTGSVKFLGFVREPSSLLTALDLFVLPSVRDEGCSNSVLEAMSHGLPSVVTNCGGLPELVEFGRTGRVAPKNHPASLAEALVDMIGDERLRASMGERARTAVEQRYTVELVTDAWESLFDELTRLSSAGASSSGALP